MRVPPFLKPGDKIAVVAPARKVLQKDIEDAIKILNDWELKPYLGKNLWKEKDQFSGDDVERKMDLQEALDDPEIKAVIAARGGYGAVRIVDLLDFTKFTKNPKWIIGFSDITVLHAHIQQNFGICTMHAPMLINFARVNKDVLLKLKKYLFGDLSSIEIPSHDLNREGTVKGEICGGNLSVLCSILCSDSDLDTTDKILFIEDLDEYLYHVDRMMMAMKRAGKFSKIKGLIVGGMNDMKDNIIPFGKTAENLISEYIADRKIPAVYNFPAGHLENNNPIIFGKEVSLSVSETVRLEYVQGKDALKAAYC